MDHISLQSVHMIGNCTPGKLNNEEGGELHEIKRSRDKTKIDKEII